MREKLCRCAGVAVSLLAVLLAAGVALKFYADSTQVYIAVTPAGPQQLVLEHGTAYLEQGAVAVYADSRGNTAVAQVTATGNVNTDKTGIYTVRYTGRWGRHFGTAYRQIRVIDTQAPVITLHNISGHYTLPGSTYQEEGFTAIDAHDGDITDRVVRTATLEKVTYTVSDDAGNTTTVTRELVYSDPVAPEITLIGGQEYTVYAGREFRDPGFTAVDNYDGDVTAQVVSTHNVDILRPGMYEAVYTVSDRAGNTATVKRRVQVTERPLPEVQTPEGKVIYLTFDDGPGKYTPELLDILKKYGAKATFFVTNSKNVEQLARIAQEGHAIGIHTATHVFEQVYASEEAYFADLYKMQDVIEAYTGQRTMLLRFPGGSSNTISQFNPGIMTRLTGLVTAHGFRYVDWNVDSDDAGRARSAARVYKNVVEGIGDREVAVVLQHDIKQYSIHAVEQILQWGLANGYRFQALQMDSPLCQHPLMN